MRIECSECGRELEVESVQQFGADATIKITPCDCQEKLLSAELDELEEAIKVVVETDKKVIEVLKDIILKYEGNL